MNIHFTGIGGIGNSALAKIFQAQGHTITGSDNSPSKITEELTNSGIKVFNQHKAENIKENLDLIVYSPAIPVTNPELTQAKKLGIRSLTYPEALGALSESYKTIAIAGTHGKSTTTAMLNLIAIEAGLDPTIVIGTKMPELGNKNFRVGKSDLLIIEACEYKDSFLEFHPQHLIITNLEADHLDHYGNFKNYKEAFRKLAEQVPENGTIVIPNCQHCKEVTANSKAKTILREDLALKPQVPGQFNIENAQAAATLAQTLEIPTEIIQKAISNFKGTWRRWEIKETNLPTQMIDDYGHHPTEIKATLEALRQQHPKAKILCIFQPHQYSRTHHLLKDFGPAFQDADEVIIPNIYKVRDSEEDISKVSTDDLVAEISKQHPGKISNGQGLEKTAEFIKNHASNYDIIITMGAGDIDKIYEHL